MSTTILLLLALGADPASPAPERTTQTVSASRRSDTIFTCMSGERPRPILMPVGTLGLKTLVVVCDPDVVQVVK